MALSEPSLDNNTDESTGLSPAVSESSLEPKQRVVETASQAYDIVTNLINDARKLIAHAALITASCDGARPYNQKKLDNQNKSWKSNINLGFLSKQVGKVVPRYVQPVKTAKYLTAAQLPILKDDGTPWPDAEKKTAYFREVITETIRSRPQWNFFVRGTANEVAKYGFGFPCFFDEYEWFPKIIRMDKGFVPKGTEVMEQPPFFAVKYQYKPAELLALLKANKSADRSEWNEENVVKAINSATVPTEVTTFEQARTYQDMIRESSWLFTETKGYKVVETYHLFAQEMDGKVSHWVVLASDSSEETGLLFKHEDQFDSMIDAVTPMVFDYGDGTIHGAWGVGQLLYDMSVQVEKVMNNAIDNLALTNKQRLQVAEAKNLNDVKVQVTDTMVVASGASFAQNIGGIAPDPGAYITLSAELTRLAEEKIGSYVPPIPLQASDIKAAQVNAAVQKEEEVKNANLDNWLSQVAVLIHAITRRLLKKGSPDPVAKKTRTKLLKRLTDEELDLLMEQPPVQNVLEFTEYNAVKKAQFAASVSGNPLFNQQFAANCMAEAAGGQRFAQEIVVAKEDDTQLAIAQRQQILENSAILQGMEVVVANSDPHKIHLDVLGPMLAKYIEGGGNPQISMSALRHASAHFVAAGALKQFTDVESNSIKSLISNAEKAINEQIEAQKAQQGEQAQQLAGQQQGQAPMQ